MQPSVVSRVYLTDHWRPYQNPGFSPAPAFTERKLRRANCELKLYRNLQYKERASIAGLGQSCRLGLSRWRGGRYRVVDPDISGTADVVWVTEKGDSRDPFTQDDAGGTPAPQLF